MAENLNLSDSAKAAGLSRKTLYTHIKSGKVSVTRYEGKRCIAVSELLRVYGNLDISSIQQGNTRLHPEKVTLSKKNDTEVILSRLQNLQDDNAALREEMQQLREATQKLLTDHSQRAEEVEELERLRKENDALRGEIKTVTPRGFWGRLLGKET